MPAAAARFPCKPGDRQAHQVHLAPARSPDSLEEFHPDRMAKRILGMGDMVSLIEQRRQGAAGRGSRPRPPSALMQPNPHAGRLHRDEPPDPQDGRRVEAHVGPARRRPCHGCQARWTKGALDDMEAIINSMTREERRAAPTSSTAAGVRASLGAPAYRSPT